MKEFQVFCRGQVWWVPENNKQSNQKMISQGDSVQAKSRSWLIVSCEENNIHSPTVNCVPISTGDQDSYPMHVFYKVDGRSQNILCEQIRTLNATDLKEYMYTLSGEMMAKVNKAIANQLSLKLEIPSYDNLVQLVEKLGIEKAKELTDRNQTVTNEVVKDIALKLEKVFNFNRNPGQTDTTKKQDSFMKPNSQESIIKRDSGRIKWTPEMKQEFLIDCETKGPSEVASKWGLKDKTTVYRYKYIFKQGEKD